jgi:hypothetical protein
MLQRLMNFLLSLDVLTGFVTGGILVYYINTFHSSWREYMRSIGASEAILSNNAPFAVFSQNLPEQCRAKRRKLIISGCTFIGAAILGVLVLYLMTLLGYVSQK